MSNKIPVKTKAALFVEQMGYDKSREGEVAYRQAGLVLHAATMLVSESQMYG